MKTNMQHLIPIPVSVSETGDAFDLNSAAAIYVPAGDDALRNIGQYFADTLKPATGFELPVLTTTNPPAAGNLFLTTAGADPALGEEGYELTITADSVTLTAHQPAGLFRGVQIIRQLLPPAIERSTPQPDPWQLPTGTIRDMPRFSYRGAMLDVARHFFSVEQVKHYIDLLAYYKMNCLHLHLTDDQGWRIMINSWPKLAEYGGSTAVDNDPGGYYTQEQYAEIVAYAQSRYMMIVPEIDLPGHTNAALAAYPELNPNDEAPPLYTGIQVGFSSLDIDKEITYQFVDDVVRELAALTPFPYIHIGGDEAAATAPADYVRFIERVQPIVEAHGKQMVGWEEIAKTALNPSSVVQFWTKESVLPAVERGAKLIMSPANRAYLDMKYNPDTPLGQDWAGLVNVQDSYTWDPVNVLEGVSESGILGVEAPLWTETIRSMDDLEYMVFPRLPGIAEIGWSPAAGRSWDEYRVRLAQHGRRFIALNVNFYRSPLMPWPNDQ